MTDNKILVVGTYAEAERLGAKRHLGTYVLDGWRVFSVGSGPQAFDGLRVTDLKVTQTALEHPRADKVLETLRRSMLKMRRCPDCGKIDGSFACRIRHIHLNTGDAKAAKD